MDYMTRTGILDAAAKYVRECPRCGGSGRYDRGTCFTCKGTGKISSSKPPGTRYEVSAIFKDGVRRVLVDKEFKSEAAAIDAGKKKMAMGMDFWQPETIEVKQK